MGDPSILNRSSGKFYNFNLHLIAGAKRINGILTTVKVTFISWILELNEGNQQFEMVNGLLKMEKNVLPSSISIDKFYWWSIGQCG